MTPARRKTGNLLFGAIRRVGSPRPTGNILRHTDNTVEIFRHVTSTRPTGNKPWRADNKPRPTANKLRHTKITISIYQTTK